MARCLARERDRARACADTLENCEAVEAVDVLAPEAGRTGRWELDILLRPRAGGVPSHILDYLGSYQFGLRDVSPQTDYWQALAVC